MNLDIVTQFADAKGLLQQAYDILVNDLRSLEGKEVAVDEATTSRDEANAKKGSISREDIADKYCDIKRVDIRAEISTMPDVYHHLDMDESYELNITSTWHFR